MKKEDLQNSQQVSGSSENKGGTRDQQKNPTTNVSNQQNINLQAGLGRDRITDLEDLGGLSKRDNMNNQNTNQPTER